MEQLVLPDVPDAVLLAAVVDRVLSRPAVELPGPLSLERTRALLLQGERLRVAALDGVRDVDARELYALDGAGGTPGWLRAQRAGGRSAPLALARRLEHRPVLRQVLTAGLLDVTSAERVCAALERLPEQVDELTVQAVLSDGVPALVQELSGGADPDPEQTSRVLDGCAAAVTSEPATRLEPAFTLLATRVAPHLVARTLGYLVDALLPEEHLERWEDEQARTDLQLRSLLDGLVDVRGTLDPETGEALRAELARRAVRSTIGDGSTPGQRRVLALRQLLRDAAAARGAVDAEVPEGWDRDGWADAEDGAGAGADPQQDLAPEQDLASEQDEAGERPAAEGAGVQLTLVERQPYGAPVRLAEVVQLPVLVGVAAVLGLPGALPGRFGRSLATSLPVDALRRLGCGAELAAVLLDAVGRPLAASGTHRNATPRERRALLAQWGGLCATEGCPNPGTVPHHVEPWWLSRRTRLRDLVPYCDSCHHDTHEGQKTIRLRNGRWISPTGWVDPPEVRAAG